MLWIYQCEYILDYEVLWLWSYWNIEWWQSTLTALRRLGRLVAGLCCVGALLWLVSTKNINKLSDYSDSMNNISSCGDLFPACHYTHTILIYLCDIPRMWWYDTAGHCSRQERILFFCSVRLACWTKVLWIIIDKDCGLWGDWIIVRIRWGLITIN